jgi:hypothetical protein
MSSTSNVGDSRTYEKDDQVLEAQYCYNRVLTDRLQAQFLASRGR